MFQRQSGFPCVIGHGVLSLLVFSCCVREIDLLNLLTALTHWLAPLSSSQITGVILLAVGVWGKVSLEAYFSLASEESTNAPYVLIGTGATIVIFGLFGCFATCRGSPWMLKLVSEGAVGPFKSSVTLFWSFPLCVSFSTPCFWSWCSLLSWWPVSQALSSDMRWV